MQQFLHSHDCCGRGPLALESSEDGNLSSWAFLLLAEHFTGNIERGFADKGFYIALLKGGLLLHDTISCHADDTFFPFAFTFAIRDDQLSTVSFHMNHLQMRVAEP